MHKKSKTFRVTILGHATARDLPRRYFSRVTDPTDGGVFKEMICGIRQFGLVFDRAICVTLARASLSAFLIYVAIAFVDFGDYVVPTPAKMADAHTAIVLGGGEGRISSGLRLIHSKVISRLFISGEDLDVQRQGRGFVGFYSSLNPDLHDIAGMLECCIEWSRTAENTFQNARESKCWLSMNGISGPIILITYPEHMARALLVFRDEMPERKFIPYPAALPWEETSQRTIRRLVLEYGKLLAVRAYLWLPFRMKNRSIYGRYQEPCA